MESGYNGFYEFVVAFIGVIFLVGGIFTLTMVLSHRRDETEKGLTPIFSERVGARFGFLNFSFPFVRITLYKDFMVISWWKKTIFEYSKIKRLDSAGLFGTGIVFVMTNTEKYGQPTVWTFSKKRILEIIYERIKSLPPKQKTIHHHRR